MEGYPRGEGVDEDSLQHLSTTGDDDTPACQSCRRRKLKCSRETPTCSSCARLRCACLYVMKQKPGLKAGAVDNLNRRLEILEKLFLDIDGNRRPELAFLDTNAIDAEGNTISQGPEASNPNVLNQSSTSQSGSQAGISSQIPSSSKRKYPMDDGPDTPKRACESGFFESLLPPLPHPALLKAIIDEHFAKVHHWIPILHAGTFKTKLKGLDESSNLTVLLHALVSASIKHVRIDEYGMSAAEMHRQIRLSREVVILNAMELPSVANLQALVIVAFDLMGCGQVTKAWSIIGSLTRTVEYLQLSVEPDEVQRNLLLRPLMLLEKSVNWTEEEERRRLFWSIFLLDRICSVTSGWNTSLTSDDVHRRLPSNGGNWAREEPADTPYFGIWDKSAAKIGNSIAYIPALYPSPSSNEHATNGSPAAKTGTTHVDVSKLGAFAYCIESTESLSQVTSFFLQQLVDFQDRQEVVSWLTRFKELDLRLVHWKMFLPQQWKDSDVSRDTSVINMDPNLTLAHITHNTSMILLHQHIAYKPVDWAGLVALPSSCSAETCHSAAIETSSIAQKYLTYMSGIVNCQFAFCLFVAARILLVQWRIDGQSLSSEFFGLIGSLQEISRRWWGSQAHDLDYGLDLAAKYSSLLEELHTRCLEDDNFGSDLLGYSEFMPNTNVGGLLPPLSINNFQIASPGKTFRGNTSQTPKAISHLNRRPSHSQYPSTNIRSPGVLLNRRYQHNNSVPIPTALSSKVVNPYMSPGSTIHPMGSSSTNIGPNHFSGLLSNNIRNSGLMGQNPAVEIEEDELTAMSNSLLGQQFLEMDRVIPFDGTDFNYQNIQGW